MKLHFQTWAFLLAIALKSQSSSAATIRAPTYQDYLDLEQIILDWATKSTCPQTNNGGESTYPHWDWDDATGDCVFFARVRNPLPLLPRLVRHAFHDSAGYMDGHVNLNDPENAGLEGSTVILDDIHASGVFPSTGDPVRNALSKADLTAWAGIAAVRLTAMRQTGRATVVDDTDHVPDIPLRYGRYTYEVGQTEPTETFPADSAASGATDLEQYFAQNFGFTAEETITIMGAHTLGEGGINESGYIGLWTETKNTFDADYYRVLMNPDPMDCSGAISDGSTGGGCFYLDTPTLCEEDPNDPTIGRCLGWEQVPVRDPVTGIRRYEWRHSCRHVDPKGCTQLMLNVDMALFRDIDDYICTNEKIALGQCTEHGMVIGFPPANPGNCVFGTSRILATCFFERAQSRDYVEVHSNNLESFIDKFAIVFDKMISTRNPPGWPALTEVLPVVVEPDVANGSPCPQACVDTYNGSANPFLCTGCESDSCGMNTANGEFICRGQGWTPPTGAANGENCPLNTSTCKSSSSATANPFACATCASGLCGKTSRPRTGDVYKCRSPNWTP